MTLPPSRTGTATAAAPPKRGALAPPSDNKDPLESALHDLTNSLSAARAFGDVILLRAEAGTLRDPALVVNLLSELDRMHEILRNVRRQTYRAGDILECAECGYTFVFRKATGKSATCRRCKSARVDRWKAPG